MDDVLKAKCVECKRKKEIVRGKDVCWQCWVGNGTALNTRIEVRKNKGNGGAASSAVEGEQFKYLG